MSNPWKYSLYIGVGALTLLALAFAAVEIQKDRDEAGSSNQKISDSNSAPAANVGQSPSLSSVATVPSSASVPVASIPPLPLNATSVPDQYLVQLAGMVDLGSAGTRPPDKNKWQLAIPVAQKLLNGPCDCAQRNWLNRFVEMGGFALSNADSEYHDYAKLMATLGRDDNQAMAMSKGQKTN